MIFRETVERPDGVGPWGPTGMTSARWRDVPPRLVRIDALIATQDGVYFHGIHADTHVGGDPLPHVVSWRGREYLEDGHHRVMRAALAGATYMEARVLHVEESADGAVA